MSTENLHDMSLHDLFRMEVDGQRPLLTDGLLVLEREPTSAGELESCMRAAHSLKGAARIIGLTAAVAIAHAMEDCLVDAQHGRITLSNSVIDVLLGGVDLLGRIAETPAADAAEWMHDDTPESARFRAALAAALATGSAPQPDATPQMVGDATNETAEAEERVLRIAASSLNRLLGLAGESLVESRWLDPFVRSLANMKVLHRRSVTALDRLVEHVPALSSDQQAAELFGQARAAIAEGHQLFNDRVVQLDMFERRIAGVAHRLYQEALASHMRPFGDGTRGAKRMVRDLARELGKDVRLEIVGAKTPVDRDVLAKLEAPLGHFLRNAIDHGIEPPIQRIADGKPAEGTIRIEAHHVSGLLEVNIEDDGQGIDLEHIRQVVVSRGLADEQTAQRFTEAELLEFLFLPGFTGRRVVTEISGRGVGLDAVQNMVKQLRGSVRISTKRGHSTRFQLHLPLTTSVLRALIVEIGGESYAFPLAHIVCTATVPRDDVRWLEGRQHFELNGRQVGLVSARQVLEGADATAAPEQLHVVVVSDHSRTHEYALAIDRFFGVSELVVQPLDMRLGKVKDISAGALLDDGTPLLIVDVEDMLRSVERLVSTGRLAQVRYDDGKEVAARKRVLVVDDSLTVRELERKLIESGGYAVEVAVDGMDGWNAVRLGQFDLVVTDIDMPRMNGIELVTLIKGDPRLRNLPVMIVSYKDREEDRRRGLDAGADFYLTKGGFHEEALLQAVIDLIGEAPA